MHKYILIAVVVLKSFNLLAQGNSRLYLLHEGTSEKLGSLGYIDLSNFQYTHLDSVKSFGNDLLIEGNQIFIVDGWGNIRIYQRNPFQIQDSILGLGARQIKKYGNQLVITSNLLDSYFKVYDLAGGSLLYEVDTSNVRDVAEGLWVENDKAYILVNGYGSDSQLVVWDLITKSKIKTLNTSKNPNDFVKIGNALYFNCLDYVFGVTFQKLDLQTDSITLTRPTSIVSWGGIAAKSSDEILFNNNMTWPTSIAKWNLTTNVIDTTYIDTCGAYAILYDTTSNTLFYSITDYNSFGKVRIKNSSIDTLITTHISPRRMFLFKDTTTEVQSAYKKEPKIYPNPAQRQVNFVLPDNFKNLSIYDINGKKIYDNFNKVETLNVNGWKKGIYVVVISTENQIYTYKLLVE